MKKNMMTKTVEALSTEENQTLHLNKSMQNSELNFTEVNTPRVVLEMEKMWLYKYYSGSWWY